MRFRGTKSKTRVRYDKLYREERAESIVLADYVSALASEVLGTTALSVDVIVDIPYLDLPVRTATPPAITIIVNELLTNAIKYAFKDDRPNRLEISARVEEDSDTQSVALTIHDNGARITLRFTGR